MRSRPWTKAHDAEVRRLVAAKRTCAEIAAALGRTVSAVENRRTVLGAKRFSKAPVARRAAAAEILRDRPKITSVELARALGCSRETATRHRRALGVPMLTRSEWTTVSGAARRVDRAARAHLPTEGERAALAALARGPLRVAEVAERCGCTYAAAHPRLTNLRAKALAFAEGSAGRGGTRWQSLEWWFAQNVGNVYAVAHKVWRRNPGSDLEELAQVCRAACARLVKTFRPKRVQFSTYALSIAYYDVLGYAMAERRRGVKVGSQLRFVASAGPVVGSLDALAGDDDEPFPVAARADGEPAPGPEFWERAVSGLSKRAAAAVLAHFRDGRPLASIGAELGVTRARVQQIVAGALQRIRTGRALAEYEPEEPKGVA